MAKGTEMLWHSEAKFPNFVPVDGQLAPGFVKGHWAPHHIAHAHKRVAQGISQAQIASELGRTYGALRIVLCRQNKEQEEREGLRPARNHRRRAKLPEPAALTPPDTPPTPAAAPAAVPGTFPQAGPVQPARQQFVWPQMPGTFFPAEQPAQQPMPYFQGMADNTADAFNALGAVSQAGQYQPAPQFNWQQMPETVFPAEQPAQQQYTMPSFNYAGMANNTNTTTSTSTTTGAMRTIDPALLSRVFDEMMLDYCASEPRPGCCAFHDFSPQ